MGPNPNLWLTWLMGQNNQLTGQQPQQENPYLSMGKEGLSGLADYFGGMEQRKQDKWRFNQQKDLYDRFRWGGEMDKPAVSPQMLSMMQNRNRQALAPTRANMLYGASRHAGLRSGQTWNMFDQNYTPIEAGMANQNQQWATGVNEQRRMFIQQLLARLAGA